MKANGVRMYGKNDIRLEEFELPEIGENELLVRVITDSMCMSTYKAVLQGSDHRCVPEDIAEHPVLIGHEFCAVVEQAGSKVSARFKPGDMVAAQPKMEMDGKIVGPGYSFRYYGGDATYMVIPEEAIEGGYLLHYNGDSFFSASTAEPFSCLISAAQSMYHLGESSKKHIMGLKKGGCMAIVAGCGPMGLGAAQAAMALPDRPKRIVITDINEQRVERARQLLKSRNGVELVVVNTKDMEDTAGTLIAEYTEGKGFDDIFIMAPVPGVIETADAMAGKDCCINFFAGPTKKEFFAQINLYDCHYNDKHLMGTSGGDVDDMVTALKLLEQGELDPAILISHVGGLNAVTDTVLQLPSIPGAKKLIYCGLDLPLTAIEDFEEAGKTDPLFAKLHEICRANRMLWCREAEQYLLEHGRKIG